MYENSSRPQAYVDARIDTRPLLRNVYAMMTIGLVVTAGAAYVTTTTPALLGLLRYPFVVFGALILEIVLVATLAVGIWKLSTGAATAIFFAYAAMNGFTLSLVLLLYAPQTLTLAFVSTAALFGAMTIVGLTTKVDLTKLGTFLFMGLIGLLIAMLVSIFFRSSTFELIISVVGVLLFTGLTAYDTQKIVRMASDPRLRAGDSNLLRRLSIMGALSLYLDFINLFLFILRLMGRRR